MQEMEEIRNAPEIRREDFLSACEAVMSSPHRRDSIGTLGEKTLHAVLKRYYEPDSDRHEIPVGSHVADIVGESGIIEIQTRGFGRLRPKLTELLEAAPVTVVYPVIAQKTIINLSSETGEVLSRRKSPKRGGLYTCIPELYTIRTLLGHTGLTVRLPFLTAEEWRLFGVKTRRRKKQRTRGGEFTSDLRPLGLMDEIVLREPSDYRVFIPEGLPGNFGAADFAQAAHIGTDDARRTLNILISLGLAENAGKNGRRFQYRLN